MAKIDDCRLKRAADLWCIFFCTLFLNSAAFADAYDGWVTSAEPELLVVAKNVVLVTKTRSNGQLSELLDRADLSVKRTGVPIPYVTSIPGQRPVITLPVEFMLMLKFIGDVSVVDYRDPSISSCAYKYLEAVRNRIYENAKLVTNGQEAKRLPVPEQWAITMGNSCQSFAKSFPIGQMNRAIRDRAIYSTIAFVVLHEYGHLALGHAPLDPEAGSAGVSDAKRAEIVLLALKASRSQEFAADAWSAQTMGTYGAVPVDMLNVEISNFFLMTTGIDCFTEAGDTHPNGLQRYSRAVSRFKLANEAALGRSWSPEEVEVERDLRQIAEKAAAILACPSG